MAAGSIPMHRSCILSASEILKSEGSKKSDSSKVNEAGRYFKATLFEGGEVFQVITHFHNCSPPFPAFFFNYSSASFFLIQAGIRFPFTTWHHLRLDGWSGMWISLSKILKYVLF